jgi:aspartyl-tRNA synthetase
LRNPIRAIDVSVVFRDSGFAVFAKAGGGRERRAGDSSHLARPEKSRSFFDKTVEAGQALGLAGVAYLVLAEQAKGPIREISVRRQARPS